MLLFLVCVRDPQFYALNDGSRGPTGNLQVLGFPPIGIMTLSSVVKEAGHETVLFDLANPETPTEHVIEEIERQKPDLVGLSFLSTTSYPYAKITARQIRAAVPDQKLAAGGVFATLNAERVKRQCPEIDYVCRGDGERLLLELLDNLDDPSPVDGVTWARADGEIVTNPERRLSRDLDQWPFPDRESLPLDYIESMPLDVPVVLSWGRFTTMQTSRGCPWPCVFCDIPIFSKGKWRPWSPEHVVAELQHLEEQGYESVVFVDDNFLLKPKRIEKICEGIIAAGLTIKWGCEGRVDSNCQYLFELMAKANCQTLMFGIESGSQRILDRLKKQQTLEQIAKAVKDAKKAGIRIVHGFFVVGSPDETAEDMEASFKFAARIPIDTFGFNRLCVYRGSPLWKEYVERGLVEDERDWYKYFKCSEIDPTCLPGPEINRIRQRGFRHIVLYKLFRYPLQFFTLIFLLLRSMSLRDIFTIISKPFIGPQSGATQAETLSRAVEHQAMKDAAAELTQVDDAELAERTAKKPEGPKPLPLAKVH